MKKFKQYVIMILCALMLSLGVAVNSNNNLTVNANSQDYFALTDSHYFYNQQVVDTSYQKAFSYIKVLESTLSVKTGNYQNLSEAYLLSKSTNATDSSYTIDNFIGNVKSIGVLLETQLPYEYYANTSTRDICKDFYETPNAVATISYYKTLLSNIQKVTLSTEADIKNHIQSKGAVSVYINIDANYSFLKQSGKNISRYAKNTSPSYYHSFTLIGWDNAYNSTGAYIAYDSQCDYNEFDGIVYIPYSLVTSASGITCDSLSSSIAITSSNTTYSNIFFEKFKASKKMVGQLNANALQKNVFEYKSKPNISFTTTNAIQSVEIIYDNEIVNYNFDFSSDFRQITAKSTLMYGEYLIKFNFSETNYAIIPFYVDSPFHVAFVTVTNFSSYVNFGICNEISAKLVNLYFSKKSNNDIEYMFIPGTYTNIVTSSNSLGDIECSDTSLIPTWNHLSGKTFTAATATRYTFNPKMYHLDRLAEEKQYSYKLRLKTPDFNEAAPLENTYTHFIISITYADEEVKFVNTFEELDEDGNKITPQTTIGMNFEIAKSKYAYALKAVNKVYSTFLNLGTITKGNVNNNQYLLATVNSTAENTGIKFDTSKNDYIVNYTGTDKLIKLGITVMWCPPGTITVNNYGKSQETDYNGSAQSFADLIVTVSDNSAYVVEYRYKIVGDTNYTSWSATKPTFINAGEYEISFRIRSSIYSITYEASEKDPCLINFKINKIDFAKHITEINLTNLIVETQSFTQNQDNSYSISLIHNIGTIYALKLPQELLDLNSSDYKLKQKFKQTDEYITVNAENFGQFTKLGETTTLYVKIEFVNYNDIEDIYKVTINKQSLVGAEIKYVDEVKYIENSEPMKTQHSLTISQSGSTYNHIYNGNSITIHIPEAITNLDSNPNDNETPYTLYQWSNELNNYVVVSQFSEFKNASTDSYSIKYKITFNDYADVTGEVKITIAKATLNIDIGKLDVITKAQGFVTSTTTISAQYNSLNNYYEYETDYLGRYIKVHLEGLPQGEYIINMLNLDGTPMLDENSQPMHTLPESINARPEAYIYKLQIEFVNYKTIEQVYSIKINKADLSDTIKQIKILTKSGDFFDENLTTYEDLVISGNHYSYTTTFNTKHFTLAIPEELSNAVLQCNYMLNNVPHITDVFPTFTNNGIYEVGFMFTPQAEHSMNFEMVSGTITITINKVRLSENSALLVETPIENKEFDYNGTAYTPVFNWGEDVDGTITHLVSKADLRIYYSLTNESSAFSEILPEIKNSGVYQIYYRVNDIYSNFLDDLNNYFMVTINKLNIETALNNEQRTDLLNNSNYYSQFGENKTFIPQILLPNSILNCFNLNDFTLYYGDSVDNMVNTSTNGNFNASYHLVQDKITVYYKLVNNSNNVEEYQSSYSVEIPKCQLLIYVRNAEVYDINISSISFRTIYNKRDNRELGVDIDVLGITATSDATKVPGEYTLTITYSNSNYDISFKNKETGELTISVNNTANLRLIVEKFVFPWHWLLIAAIVAGVFYILIAILRHLRTRKSQSIKSNLLYQIKQKNGMDTLGVGGNKQINERNQRLHKNTLITKQQKKAKKKLEKQQKKQHENLKKIHKK